MRDWVLALLGLLSACRGRTVATGSDAGNRRITPLEMNRVLLRSYPSVRSNCYEQALRRKPGLDGTVTVQLTIDASGAVTKAEALGADDPLGGNLADADVVACVVRRVSELRFPPRDGAMQIVFPFLFEPRDDDGGMEAGAPSVERERTKP